MFKQKNEILQNYKKNLYDGNEMFTILFKVGKNNYFHRKFLISCITTTFNCFMEFYKKFKIKQFFFCNFFYKNFFYFIENLSFFYFFLKLVKNFYILKLFFHKSYFDFFLYEKKFLYAKIIKTSESFFQLISYRCFPTFFLENFLLEIELFSENDKRFIFFENYFIEKFFRINYSFMIFLTDQSLNEHYFSFIKGRLDFLSDIFGFLFLKKKIKKNEFFFTDNISQMYETLKIKNRYRINSTIEKNINIMPIIREDLRPNNLNFEFKNKFLIERKSIEFKIDLAFFKEYNFYQKNTRVQKTKWIKLENKNYFFCRNFIFKICIYNPFGTIVDLLELCWFRLLNKNSHYLNHLLLSIFFSFSLKNENNDLISYSKLIKHLCRNVTNNFCFCLFFFQKKFINDWINLSIEYQKFTVKKIFLYFNNFNHFLKKIFSSLNFFLVCRFSKKIIKLTFFLIIQITVFGILFHRKKFFSFKKKKININIVKKFKKITFDKKIPENFKAFPYSFYNFFKINIRYFRFYSLFLSKLKLIPHYFVKFFSKFFISSLPKAFLKKFKIQRRSKIFQNFESIFFYFNIFLLFEKIIFNEFFDNLLTEKIFEFNYFLYSTNFFLFSKFENIFLQFFLKIKKNFFKWKKMSKIYIKNLNKTEKKLIHISFLNLKKTKKNFKYQIKKFQKYKIGGTEININQKIDEIFENSFQLSEKYCSFFFKFLFFTIDSYKNDGFKKFHEDFGFSIKKKKINFIYN